MTSPARKLRHPWPFRRVAIVLSGGGALGAYEIGVLKVLESLGLKPAILAGVSVGAMNAVVWLAHRFRTEPLERLWLTIKPSTIGMRWVTLALRAASGLIIAFAVLETILTLVGAPEIGSVRRFVSLRDVAGYEMYSLVLEAVAWIGIGVMGYFLGAVSWRIEEWLDRAESPGAPQRGPRIFGAILVGASLGYLLVLYLGIPWARRFHATLLLIGWFFWLFNRSGKAGDWIRDAFLRLMPETRGRGLWRSSAPREILKKLVAAGDPKALVEGDVHLIVSACAVDSGRMSYFVNWENPSEEFRKRIDLAIGDVVEVLSPRDVIDATVASCAIPIVFEPMRFRGREYLDAGLFTNQPLQAVVADGADAILLVLVSPSTGPRKPSRHANIIELGGRLQELANWRDLQTELRLLPARFTREGTPARVCVIEPSKPLPGTLFGYDPKKSQELIELGERDAWKALERAEWLEESS